MIIDDLLREVLNFGASDLHISSGLPPVVRVDGNLMRTKHNPLSPEDVEALLFPMLNNDQRRTLEQVWELDMSYGIENLGRFRVNIYKNKGTYAAAFRSIISKVPSFDSLGLSDTVRTITERPRGLILVTGPTGSGKSTTLAAMIDYINETRSEHILTIEDPIEFVHKSKKSIIHQRELNQDTRSFANALKSSLREDPDII
ncbi:Flp pilus assembly complex ATPase component TadA, partial [bacterium]|nr:Flp pilus assembly complex ATPase component TadA [bacterium]